MKTGLHERYVMRKSAILTLLWLMASAPIAGAGPAPTVLSGTVLNSRGVPVAGARVFWQASDGRAPHALHTDAKGKFRVDPLREGWYDLRAEAAGSWSDWEHNVIVRHGRQVYLKIRAAMLNMFIAIRERCARVMREGGAIPETS